MRFIAIGDFFDSNDHMDGTGGIDVAFRFIMHEHYSKDLSKKIRSALRVRMERGEHIVGGAVYGYRKNDAGKWELDPEPAEVVRQIFQMALEGLSTSQIRDRLFQARYPSPKEYEGIKQGKEIVPKCMWATKQLHRILINEQYTGSYVAGKQESSRIGTKSLIVHDRSKWIIFPNSHPAIVSVEDFEKVQDMLKNPKEAAPSKPVPNKISRSCRVRIESGERKSSAVPYGYVKSNGGDWEIDDTAAKVVREIYEMTLQGLTIAEVCNKLHESGYPSPAEYIKLSRGMDIQPENRWPALRIRDILKNEQYTGTFLAGRTYQDTEGKKYHTPRSEWIIIPDRHPPIISKEVFDEVQEIRARSRKNMHRRDYLLHGKISCGCCGYAMIYGDTTSIPMYRCIRTHADPAAECHRMKVSAPEIEEAVMTIIKKQAAVVLDSDDLMVIKKKNEVERIIAEYEKQIGYWVEQRQKSFERFVLNEIDRETHKKLMSEYTEQLDRLNNQLSVIKQSERDKRESKKTALLAKEVLNVTTSQKDIVNALIEKILVFPGNRLEIQWKFVNFAAGQ